MVREREERDAQVGEDKVFRHKVQDLGEGVDHVAGFGRQVGRRVVRLGHAAKQNGDNPCAGYTIHTFLLTCVQSAKSLPKIRPEMRSPCVED